MAVGFEFQTFVKVYSISKQLEDSLVEAYRKFKTGAEINEFWEAARKRNDLGYFQKGTVLYRDPVAKWQVVADGADIEFVTDPVHIDNPNGSKIVPVESTLVAQMDRLTRWADQLNEFHTRLGRPSQCEWIWLGDNRFLFWKFPSFVVHWPRNQNHELTGFAQISGGVRLSRLRKLFRLLAKNKASAQVFLGKGYAESYSKILSKIVGNLPHDKIADSRWKEHKPSARLRGLMTMLAVYLFKGRNPGTSKIPVVKHLLFIMARTNFAALFSQLPGDEQDRYKQRPDDFVNFACVDVMKLVLKNDTGLDPNGKLIEFLVNDYGNVPQGVEIPIARKDWLTEITRGRDLLTAAAHPAANEPQYLDAHGEHRLRGAGALGGTMDKIVLGTLEAQAPVFEFRGPGVDVSVMPYTAWKGYAIKALRMLVAINTHKKSEAIDEDAVMSG